MVKGIFENHFENHEISISIFDYCPTLVQTSNLERKRGRERKLSV
jgi:hypothetical protein